MKSYCKSIMCHQRVLSCLGVLVGLGMQSISAADYPTTILGDKPIAYYRLEETSGDVAADSSASGQYPGYYILSLPNGAYPALGLPGIDTNSIGLSSANPSSVSIGYYPELNQQAPFSFEIWARPASLSGTDYRCPIGNFSGWNVAHYSGWYVYQTPGNQFVFITAAGGVWLTGPVITPMQWYHLVGTFDGINASFYVNGVLVGTQSASGYVANSVENGGVNVLGLGQRGDNAQYFDGNVDEAAYYTNALTAAQVRTHYQTGTNSFRAVAVAPSVLTDLISTNAYAGHTVQFKVIADGTAPLSYLWYKGSTRISGATGNTYAFTCVPADDGATYQVVITNSIGSVTSSVASLSVSTGMQINGPLTSITRNTGGAAAFEVAAEGALPLSYQWHKGDGSTITGATNPVLWLNKVQLSDNNASFYVSIINPYSSMDSSPATLTVQSRAVAVPLTRYAKVVAADGPVAYWRLDEPAGSTTAVDAVGSFDGSYVPGAGSFTFGVPTGIPNESDSAIGVANQATVSIPYAIEINPTGAFSVEGWFKPDSIATDGNDYRTALSSISNPWGQGPTGWLVYQTGANNWSWWPYNGYWNGVQLTDPEAVVAGRWYYLAMTYDGSLFTFYVNGEAKASGTDAGFVQNGNVPAGSQDYNYNYNQNHDLSASSPLTLGWRNPTDFHPFAGAIDEVAVYSKALSAQQVQNHYLNSTHLSCTSAGANLVVSWPVGTLQSSTNVSGPYTNVLGASSPFTNVLGGPQRFYRVQVQ